MRWQGTTTLIGLRPTLVATARTAVGCEADEASAEYDMVLPRGTSSSERHTLHWNRVPTKSALLGRVAVISILRLVLENVALGKACFISRSATSRVRCVVKVAKHSHPRVHAVRHSP